MADTEFKLPVSGLDQLEKIIIGYANLGDRATLDSVASTSGINKDEVTRNNGFLMSIGLIDGGKQKTATDLCETLGKAILHDQEPEVLRAYGELVQSNDVLSDTVTYVRVQKGVSRDDLAKNIAFRAKAPDNERARRGAGAVADLLIRAGVLYEDGDRIQVATTPAPAATESTPSDDGNLLTEPAPLAPPPSRTGAPTPIPLARSTRTDSGLNITINIELEIPATDKPDVYDNLFRALREHLINPATADDEGEG